jgi:hypothetical protein
VSDGLSTVQDWVLVPGLALRGMAPDSHLITNDDAVWRWVILSFVHALTRCAPLVVGTLLKAWFYHQTQASHTVSPLVWMTLRFPKRRWLVETIP